MVGRQLPEGSSVPVGLLFFWVWSSSGDGQTKSDFSSSLQFSANPTDSDSGGENRFSSVCCLILCANMKGFAKFRRRIHLRATHSQAKWSFKNLNKKRNRLYPYDYEIRIDSPMQSRTKN
jgi:hypothetical protein